MDRIPFSDSLHEGLRVLGVMRLTHETAKKRLGLHMVPYVSAQKGLGMGIPF